MSETQCVCKAAGARQNLLWYGPFRGAPQVGSFQMAPGGKKAGPPPAVKKVLSLFGSGKEEDKLAGYLSFLKIGPKLLKFLPIQKAQDLRSWCALPALAAVC